MPVRLAIMVRKSGHAKLRCSPVCTAVSAMHRKPDVRTVHSAPDHMKARHLLQHLHSTRTSVQQMPAAWFCRRSISQREPPSNSLAGTTTAHGPASRKRSLQETNAAMMGVPRLSGLPAGAWYCSERPSGIGQSGAQALAGTASAGCFAHPALHSADHQTTGHRPCPVHTARPLELSLGDCGGAACIRMPALTMAWRSWGTPAREGGTCSATNRRQLPTIFTAAAKHVSTWMDKLVDILE